MTKFVCSVALAGFALSCALPTGVEAQRRIAVGIGAGATVTSAGAGVGYHGLVNVQRRLGEGPFSLRLEGALHRGGVATLSYRSWNATANVLFVPSWSGPRPYVLAGIGTYIGPATGLQPGANAGAGAEFRIANVPAFAELRVHVFRRRAWEDDGEFVASAFVPLTFGIRF